MKRRQGFTDRRGHQWFPDPTSRFTFRVKDGDRWTAEVCMVRGQEPGHDPEGAALLLDGDGADLDPADPRTDVFADDVPAAEPSPGRTALGETMWRHRVVETSRLGLESWLDAQGRAGWELVSIVEGGGADSSGPELIAVFKRPTTQAPPEAT